VEIQKVLRGVHTCNVTAYRNIVSWQCGRDSWPRNVSKVGYAVTLRACSVRCRYLAITSKGWAGVDVQGDTSPLSAPLPFFSFPMPLSWNVVRIYSDVRFLERFGNCEMEWTQESAIELIKPYKRKEIIWDPKHPMHFSKSSDCNLVLKFFHKKQIIIFIFPVCNPSVFQQELHTLPARCSWLFVWKFWRGAAG